MLEGEELEMELEEEVATATEAHADMISDEGSEGSTDNDDFCILEAPGMGIPVSACVCVRVCNCFPRCECQG